MRESRPLAPGVIPSAPPLVSGEVRLRVRYCECDPMGVAHHAAYIPWLEIGRTELLRPSGVTYAQMEASGIFLVVARLDIRYKAPARYDDELSLITRVTGGGRARLDHQYELWRYDGADAGRTVLLATAHTMLACVSAGGRPEPLPEWLRAGAADRS